MSLYRVIPRLGEWARARRAILVALGAFLLVGVLCMPAREYEGDPVAIRYETVHLLNEGSLGVPEAIARSMGERGQYFFENEERGRWFPKYGILNTLLYLPPLLAEKIIEGGLQYDNPSRVIYLNLFNLLVGALSFLYLYLITRDYPVRAGTQWLFLFAACFTTFWWNYLRAQNSECYQVLFFLGFFHHFSRFLKRYPDVAARRALPDRQLLIAMFFAGLLTQVKLLYVLIPAAMPVILVAADRLGGKGAPMDSFRRVMGLKRLFAKQFILPALAIALTIGMVNDYKFGSPFDTGYRQWSRESQLLSGSALEAFYGYAFSGQGSVFLHFPLLIPALLGYREFFRKHAHQALILAFLLPIFFGVCCKFANWRGEWCYGPRYMLVFLPLLSLPFLLAWENIPRMRGSREGALFKGILLAALLVSAILQVSVNSLPFMAYYQLHYLARQWYPPKEVDDYFRGRHFGLINAGLIYSRAFKSWPAIAGNAPPAEPDSELFERQLDQGMSPNYFWLHPPEKTHLHSW